MLGRFDRAAIFSRMSRRLITRLECAHRVLDRATTLPVVLVAWLAVLTVGAAPATARASEWSPPVRVSALGGLATYPQVAFDARGNAVAVWTELHGAGLTTS
jgi:hypothetical protein